MDEQEFCARWAAVWFALSRYAHSCSRLGIAERFCDAGEDIYEVLESGGTHETTMGDGGLAGRMRAAARRIERRMSAGGMSDAGAHGAGGNGNARDTGDD